MRATASSVSPDHLRYVDHHWSARYPVPFQCRMQSIDEPLTVIHTENPVSDQPPLGILGIQTDEPSRQVGPHNDRPSVHTANPDASVT